MAGTIGRARTPPAWRASDGDCGHTPAVASDQKPLTELSVGGLTLRGVAAGGVETCLMVRELGLMFDVGRCPPGATGYGRLLSSHGHADHLGAVAYWVSQRHLMRQPAPTIHFPAEIEAPLRTIFECWREIEDFGLECTLSPTRPGDAFDVGKGHRVRALRTVHRVPSLAYLVERETHKLKPELEGLPGKEIKARKERGEAITDPHVTPLLCVTGDTQIEFVLDHPEIWKAKVLVHEVTSWDDRRDVGATRKWGHTHVDEMIAHAEKFEGEALVLVHRSLRHSVRQAEGVVRERFPASVRDKIHVFA